MAMIMASAGSFGDQHPARLPVLGAFLIMEIAGVSGMTLSLVALPGLLASGIRALVFVGLDNWTGLGTFSGTDIRTARGPPNLGHPGLGARHGSSSRL